MIKIIYNNGDIMIILSGRINFDINFLSNIAKLFDVLKPVNYKYHNLLFRCDKSTHIEKLALAYIYNVCSYMKKTMKIKIFMSENFYYKLTGIVNNMSGEKYKEQEFKQEIATEDIKHYILYGEDEINAVVNDLIKFIMDTNVILDKDNVQSFLKTTIGEVFSNACIHNNINEYYYFKDIIFENDNFYLIVNVVDYGNTIAKNVESYFRKNKISRDCCIEWAIGAGNTTREGSGGYGLPTLLDYVEKAEGDLIILSGNEILHMKNGHKNFQNKLLGFFPGTAVCFKIKLYDLDNCFIYDEKNKTLFTRRISLNDI